MRLNELELFKEKTKAKKEKIYRKEITWTLDQVINN
jgi:hypothetical protein